MSYITPTIRPMNLKPCPFCGGPARILGPEDTAFGVRCDDMFKCGIELWPESVHSEEEAAAHWNRRVPELIAPTPAITEASADLASAADRPRLTRDELESLAREGRKIGRELEKRFKAMKTLTPEDLSRRSK